ncbi:hypothetical protein C8J57DRAFT_603266 [Mycena rebaudengoi]|nr:hypothetical protein C8J57DRAFT_603266 [Mycena rebaudengoi]
MADVQSHTARLIALFVSCVLYGILFTTFVLSMRSLLFSANQSKIHLKSRHEIKYPIVVATALMFFISTFSAVMSLQDVLEAFVNYDGPGGAREFYHSQNRGWKHWIVAVEDAAQVIIGDTLLIYRCYVLYDRKWRAIALPGSIWVAMSVICTLTAYREAMLPKGSSLDDPSMRPILTASILLTLATSSVTTYLIIRRLVSIQSLPELIGDIQPHFLSRVARLFFESGLLYTLSIIASLGVYITGSELEYVATGAMVHIVPISCNLLLLRVDGINRIKLPYFALQAGDVLSR